jgi:UDP-N-acetylglucosamine pyrophosphorylase
MTRIHQIQDFQARFKTIPKIVDLEHLTVSGDVHFGRNVTLRGTVIGMLHSQKFYPCVDNLLSMFLISFQSSRMKVIESIFLMDA